MWIDADAYPRQEWGGRDAACAQALPSHSAMRRQARRSMMVPEPLAAVDNRYGCRT